MRNNKIGRRRAITGAPSLVCSPPQVEKNLFLLTPKQTAELLGVTEGTLSVWRCVHRYRLTFIKVGGRVMYRPSDINEFIASRAVTPAAINAGEV